MNPLAEYQGNAVNGFTVHKMESVNYKNVYVQKITGYVQKLKAFVLCLHMMEHFHYTEKIENCVFTKN